MAELVEDERGHGEDEDDEDQHRLVQHLQHRLDRPEEAEKPDVQDDRREQHGGDHGRPVQPPQGPGDPCRTALVEDHPVALEGEQQVGARGVDLVVLLALGHRHAERLELVLQQVADVLAADLAAVAGTDPVGDRVGVAQAVDGRRHQVQQPCQLDDLPVPPTGDVLGFGEARALVLAVQPQPRAEPRGRSCRCGDGRQAARRHLLVRHRPAPGPGYRAGVVERGPVPEHRHMWSPPTCCRFPPAIPRGRTAPHARKRSAPAVVVATA